MKGKIHGWTCAEYQSFLEGSRKELAELEEWMNTWEDNSKKVPFDIRKYAECLRRAHRDDIGRYLDRISQFDQE